MLRLSLSLTCLVLSVTVGHADDGADPLQALRNAAGKNDPEAQYSLAIEILRYCQPSKEQQDEAIRWLRAAADRPGSSQPVAKAQLRLARFFDAGTYTGKDIDEALRWYRRAADNLVVEAMVRLAEVHLARKGAPSPDSAEGVQWLQKAAHVGSPEAETWLGVLYAHGGAVPRDYAESRKWFLRSAPTMLNWSCWPNNWPRRRFGNCLPAEYLGTFFAEGLGTPQNDDAARLWFEAASRNYSPYSDYSLGIMYERGKGVPADIAKALAYYRASAQRNFRAAQYRLGLAYLHGDGVPADQAEALKWFSLAIEQRLTTISQSGLVGRKRRDSNIESNRGLSGRRGELDEAAYEDALAEAVELARTLDPQELAKADASIRAFELRYFAGPGHPPPAPPCRPQR
ncbi:MAG: hypothetical protein B7Y08_05190 [Rhodospirillales bacterium 24-66-33]|jgi:TPR repeat protein|nr:tetratricopeptide repeat protein [Reyranella sp.]OYY40863.1 MAG: hypothetical protein B7Y57_14935 [Rhodospirillales bacterium 35-66-84]OYZ95831.1 MAG: hypothetical protein B7Y08_05190 [Rhodospirillales bacterium 24-66-33]OZB25712.1 MAG: hypothetical protein B7X63_10095 [Rhodospirillales bacterium 39-66-50]HQT12455.1 tetratricopeptide repeat protein [Reyranella sp.]